MNLVEFLQELSCQGVKFWIEGEKLRSGGFQDVVTPTVIAKLKQHKAEIIQLLRDRPDILNVHPLSYGQKALWFLWEFEPLSAAYNQVFSTRICDYIDLKKLRSAFEELLERHPGLRSTFPKLGAQPIQQVHQDKKVDFQLLDARAMSEAELYSSVIRESQRPFDLEKQPVIGIRLFTISQQEHILLLTIHHIATDGWSLDIILHELPKLYQAQQDGVLASLPTLNYSYSDYVRSQNKMLSGSEGEKLWRYWQDKLKGELPILNLPTDKPRPPIQKYNGASHNFQLSSQLTQQLKQLAMLSDATLYMTLLAAMMVLLYRYTGQEDILVGSPIAGRLQSQFRGIVGYFANPGVLRGDLSNNPSFKEFLTQVRQTVLEALTHQEYPFALLVENLQPQRDPSRSPIFQASFALQELQKSQDIQKLFVDEIEKDVDWGGLKLRPFEIPQQEGQFDLDLEMLEGSSSVKGIFKYNTDLFDGSTIERMAAHFQNLLSAIVENPQQVVSELPLLSERERHQLLVEWNDTASDYPTDKCIHQLFEEQVEKTPNAIAVVFGQEQLTYHQLNQRANQLAHHLLSMGVGPEVLVGICVERSIQMVVGLLGILKAGGAYVPLDSNYPQERLSYMLEDSGVEVLLTQQSLLESLPSHRAQMVCLDSDWPAIEQHSGENLDVGVHSDNLAYVIYTSGSTGQPKGVAIEHCSVCNLAFAQKNLFDLEPTSRVLQFASISFDASVWEIVMAVTNGAMLILGTASELMPGDDLKQILHQSGVTHVTLPPSALAVLPTDELTALGQIIVAGEACPIELVNQWSVGRRFFNAYGPTESTVCATVAQISDGSEKITIGHPIANTKIYILDKHLQPLPIGVPGELYIGGDGLARGYLNRQELTKQKFIQNPFCNSNSERLYKTSDLARYLRDGNIEFIGRIDNQVKIRGFRIELGEIEAVLNTHPQIQQTVVIATEDLPGHKRLVAYIVSEEESLTTNQVREFLKQKLPDYMVPSAFVTLDSLPLTPNGKVDRKSLPAPDGVVTSVEEYVAPRTEIEQTLTNLWEELLAKDKVSIHDNFFEIGGDSILSIQVVSRAKNSGIHITPQQIFLHQTIAELARVATTGVTINAQQGLVTGVAPLTPIQKRFFAQNKQELHHYNQSVLLEISNHLASELIKTAIGKLLEHHDALRLRFPDRASEEQQHNLSLDHNVPFDLVDLSSTPEEEQVVTLSKIATDYQRSLNLEDGPIMQVVRFNLGQERSARLLIIIHHLAVDGVSWRILLSDLATIYQQLTEQHPIQLSPKTTAFIDWADKLNNYAQSEILLKELDYWLNQPWSKITPLPKDYGHPNSENTIGSAGYVSRELSVEETTALLGSVNQAYNTQINDILLSGLVLSLAQWTGNSTVLIDLEGHGREELFSDVDLSRTVGWFTSLFPVLLQLASLNQLPSVIKSIKEQLRAIPNRGIGYGLLRYLCQDTTVNQQLQTIPTAEICFNYLGQFDQVQSQTGWKFGSFSTGANQSEKQYRDHLLEINALVVEGKLQINWTYSSNVHSLATVASLADSYHKALRSIIKHCQLEEAFGYTPSDFPDAQLNQDELDQLLAPIKTKNVSEIYPLSPMQQGMLFHSLYAPDSGVYFEQMTFKIKGNLNVEALRKSWQLVVDRYSILRTFFVWENRPTPLQVVLKQVNLPWSNLDWREFSATEQQQQLSEMLSTQRESGFQLNLAPLMKCSLIQLSEQTYQFIWSHHHLLMDGWCLAIIFKEVFSFYEAELTGKTCNLPTPRPYGDYIAWLHEQDQETAFEFWRETLLSFSAPTALVVDKPQYHNPQQNSDYQELELRLSDQVSHQLESVARQHYVTLSTLVQGAWALLLSRYSGEEDVVFGVTVSGRPPSLDGVETMVGLFINTLPLRLQVSPGEKLIAWWQQIQQLMSQLQTYCYTPLVEIQGMSEVPGGIPLFESILVFENYPFDRSLLNQESLLELEEIESFEQTNYPLTVVAIPGEQLSIKISYDTLRFDQDTIERMLGHLQTIFSAIVDNPQQEVGELPLLSAEERHQLLVEWNDTASEYPIDKCIHQLFEEQVEKTPDAIAVVFGQEQLTYHQLNQRANQLAHYLQNLGVGPEVLVGICVERSIEMVVGLLGILKAGGAYVPLDPYYPPERLSYMLADSGVEVLLTQSSLLKSLPQNQARVVCLDTDGEAIEQECGDNLNAGVKSDNLAYVIYTSGSTGQPKGVAIEHKSIFNYVCSVITTIHVKPSSNFALVSTISADLGNTVIFPCLLTGGCLHVISQEKASDPNSLSEYFSYYHIEYLKIVPSHLAALQASSNPALVLPSQTLILGGEASSSDWIETIQAQSPNSNIINHYGPTEATVGVLTYFLDKKSLPLRTSILPIGRPIANTQIYILNKHLQPVPIGVLGELYIGGDGLARGYLNRPELTKQKFIPNPLCNSKSERLYKTSDLARYLPDGNIEFLGRIDNQVKIRGFRIELGEIEAVLSTHPQIQQTVVIAREDIPGNKRLVAYVVSEEESLSTHQVREFLKQKLPDYMVPSAFVTLDTLPLTPNGKVDRFALPAPEAEITSVEEYVAPCTTIELELTQIWSEVLNLTSVGVQDNFFELGGHSLNAVSLMSKIQQQFQINLPLATLFKSPTIEQLASLLGSSVNTQNPILVGIKTSGNQPPLFCIHPVGGNVLCYAELARHLAQDYPVYGLQSLGLDGQQQPLTSVEEMASHYIEAIQQIQPQGPDHLIGWSLGGVIAYEMAQQLQAKNEPVALLTLIDSYAPTLIRKPSEIDQAMIVNQLAQDLGGLYGQELDISHETLRKLEPDEQVLHLFEQAKKQGIFPSDLEIEQMRSLWEVFQANLMAIYHYKPKAYPGSLLLINASQTSPAVIEDPTHGWGSLVNGDLQTHTITGDHFTIMKAPQVEGLTAELNNYLLNN
ncbi:hypothetical protein BJP34_27455 [Moorena producens PAL-8-15-08-1]|uniref:Carrier domain-containing protein n=1 Tax=Moorena producens PAL-8-15-08-1 TaxID=1458985 RepID=A0A1D8TYE3_9CYAN|nr:non-ribosomal peptide synthetase [Moorena producens]AOX02680.1 hypothetical protein BJP34_27455 [Moorena producens PAL-8-15-08-1]